MKKSIIFGSIAGLAVALYAAGYIYLYSFVPDRSGAEKLPGLSAEVQVYYDSYGVPHIEATNRQDAARALGYVHAKDRLFQMEMIRRVARGRLAEILGPDLVEVDKLFRTLRLDQFAEEYVKELDLETPYVQHSQAYLEGVNAYIDNGEMPLEFSLLGISPEHFTLSDSIAIAGYMAYTFASALKQEPLLTYVKEELGDQYLNDLNYDLHPNANLSRSRFDYSNTQEGAWHGPEVQSRTQAENTARMKALREIAALAERTDVVRQSIAMFEGSNAWAVAPSRSTTGQAMLAGDPHISFSQPQVWFEAHTRTPDFEIYGYYLAGIPVPLLGHNRGKAWSLTMFQNDDMDLYAESLNPENPGQVMYQGRPEDIQREDVTIKVKGEPDVKHTVRITRHGPIINDVLDSIKDKPPIALKWAFHDKENSILEAFYTMMEASDMQEFEKGVSMIGAPGLNVMYADSAGNIAWWAAAHLPRRAPGADPSFMLEGKGGEEWQGRIPFAQNPQKKNPESGYLITANEQPRENVVPGYYNFVHRAYKVNDYLQSQEYVSPDEMKELQGDISFTYGVDQIKVIDSIIGAKVPQNPQSRTAYAYMKQWNGQYDAESVGASIFTELLYQIAYEAAHDEFKDEFFKSFIEARFYYDAIGTMLANPNSPYWDNRDTEARETREEILLKAWQNTLEVLEDELGSNPGNWLWRRLHTVEYVHAIGRKWPFNMVFNLGPYPAVGSTETVFNLYHGQSSGVL
ncbi:MAG: penicillin acylase family protein, partial [Leptospiraceae bacterium]|nr:penicillin acylase family protein [Leptospiraceae bacterium]